MKCYSTIIFLLFSSVLFSQEDSLVTNHDSINNSALELYNKKINELDSQRISDSLKKLELEKQLSTLESTDELEKSLILRQLLAIERSEEQRVLLKKAKIDSLKKVSKGFPVIGTMGDTLFYIYNKIGASTAKERAANITNKIDILYNDDFFNKDSITLEKSESSIEIIYHDIILMSVSTNDAIWHDGDLESTSILFKDKIIKSIEDGKEEYSYLNLLIRIAWIILILIIAYLIVWLIRKAYNRLVNYINSNEIGWLKALEYKDYTFLSTEKELQIILFLLKGALWFTYGIVGYITLPIVFSIFPFTRNWAHTLFGFIWSPVTNAIDSIIEFIPNLFAILVIIFAMRYLIKFVHYIFKEIESGKLNISGFHQDWALPTYSIVKFLLYAFMFVLIFPYLPGSGSTVFQGVSVFIGVLFSLGSSTAISNMVAGLVITYMRPFKINDRIKIGDVTGDVLEKTLLVTRIRTPKNEVITIPNSSVLSGNTINYSSETKDNGLIVHTTITIGYDVPWKDMHEALIEAALRTEFIVKSPSPFVLQTSLEDFYVAYQINAYTKAANKQAGIYSNLHQNIQDVCNERGIEILSPHYRAARDGNQITIPANYLSPDYKAPSFNININKEK